VNQRYWNYFDRNGRKNTLGLAHSPSSGHLMVYYNQEILIVDFNILHDKSYSFYVDEEFCHLNISISDGKFDYQVDIDHHIDTPKNIARKAAEIADWKMKLKIASITIGVIIMIYFFAIYCFRQN